MHSIILLSTKFDDVKKKDDGIYIYKAINKEFLLIIVFLFGLLVFLSLSKKKKGKEIIILSPLGFIDLLLLTFAMGRCPLTNIRFHFSHIDRFGKLKFH